MKPWIKWTLGLVIVCLLATGIWRALSSRKAQQAALAVQTEQAANPEVELLASDVVMVQTPGIDPHFGHLGLTQGGELGFHQGPGGG